MNKKIITKNVEETFKIAEELAVILKPGDVVALIGNLGAGKTHFVKGLANGLNIDKKTYISSPSYTLLNEYFGDLPLYHFDFYRLERAEDLDELGLDEYFFGKGITAIEWANKFLEILPKKTIFVDFKIIDEFTREINIVSKDLL